MLFCFLSLVHAMRKQAFILLIPFSVFIAETASFIPAMQNACEMISAKESSCCMIVEKKAESPCADENTGSETPDDCTDKPDCSTCPVCYTFIFQQLYEWNARQFTFKKIYGLQYAGHLSSYTANVWKPPNGLSL